MRVESKVVDRGSPCYGAVRGNPAEARHQNCCARPPPCCGVAVAWGDAAALDLRFTNTSAAMAWSEAPGVVSPDPRKRQEAPLMT